jgi:hypothetical protein
VSVQLQASSRKVYLTDFEETFTFCGKYTYARKDVGLNVHAEEKAKCIFTSCRQTGRYKSYDESSQQVV